MKRIYSNYNDSDFNVVKMASSELGYTPAAFQRYCTLLYISKKNPQTFTVSTINSIMFKKLQTFSVGDTFIVSALFPAEIWTGFSRSDKTTAAKQLVSFAKRYPDFISPCGKTKTKTTIYKILKKINFNSQDVSNE